MILTDANLQLWIAQNVKKRLITNEYTKDPNNPNFVYVQNKFFKKEPTEKVALLNIGSWLFQSVTDTYSFYIWDKWDGMNYRRYIEDFATLWYFCYSIERDENGQYTIMYQPAENYINDKWVDTVLRKYVDTDRWLANEYILKTTFVGWIVINSLYSSNGSQVPLDTLRETSQLQEVVNTWLPQVFRVCKEDKREQFPLSIISKIENTVYSIDRNIVMLETQFLQHGEVFRIFKNVQVPTSMLDDYTEGKKIDRAKIWHDLIWVSGDASIEYVSNKNELIDKIQIQNENMIRQISSMTSVPVDFLGLESKEWNIGQGSRTLLQWSFLKKITWFRSFLDKCFEDALAIVWDESEKAMRGDIFIKDDNELINELKVAREIKVISHIKAIMDYQGIDEMEAEKEMKLIEEENEKAMSLLHNKNIDASTSWLQDTTDNQEQGEWIAIK